MRAEELRTAAENLQPLSRQYFLRIAQTYDLMADHLDRLQRQLEPGGERPARAGDGTRWKSSK